MTNELKLCLMAALQGKPAANFSAEDTNEAAVKGIMKELGLGENPSPREIRAVEDRAFALIEESVDEIMPKKLQSVLGGFAEVKTFARDAEVVFNIEKIGKNRAKLTISKGARGGIYRAARLANKFFSPETHVETVAVYVTLEEIILGTQTLAELYNNVLEGFEEKIYKEVFNALASGTPVAGYGRIGEGTGAIVTPAADLGPAIDAVMPYVKQYGVPSIFGSYSSLQNLYNPLAATTGGYPNLEDSQDIRKYGFIQVYKGAKCVELPNYLVDNSNKEWFYDPSYVFILPSDAKPVKVALKGELYLKKNEHAVGSEKWEAHKIIGVGLAMANNYAVIKVADEGSGSGN
jgi:hypothetical protein